MIISKKGDDVSTKLTSNNKMKIFKTEEKNKNEDNKNVSRQIEKKISNKVFVNLLIAILIMAYFCVLSLLYKNLGDVDTINIVKGSTVVFLAIALVLIEVAYKKESKILLIHVFEALALATHSLTTMHITKLYNFDFQKYILWSSYLFSIYYVLKTIIINTKARKDYLEGLSDISKIVQKDEPTKKEATKKEKVGNKKKDEDVIEENKENEEEKSIQKEITKYKEDNDVKEDEESEEDKTEEIKAENKSKTRNKNIANLWAKLEQLNEEQKLEAEIEKKEESEKIKEESEKIKEESEKIKEESEKIKGDFEKTKEGSKKIKEKIKMKKLKL